MARIPTRSPVEWVPRDLSLSLSLCLSLYRLLDQLLVKHSPSGQPRVTINRQLPPTANR